MLAGARLSLIAVPLAALFAMPCPASAQNRPAQGDEIPSIALKTQAMRKIDGFFPLYWEESAGKLWMEIPRLDTEILHTTGLAAGLGSNDIGLDRGQNRGSEIVVFERVGPRVLMVQPNYEFRASSTNPAEVRAVRDAFARSVLWGFTIAAEADGRVLVDLTDFLMTDQSGIGDQMRPGQYRVETSRSAVYLPMTMGFPKNTEIEVELTFTQRQTSRVGGFFEGVGSVAATADAATLRVHHSFVELPGPGFTARTYDSRAGYFPFSYRDYSAPLSESITRRFITRHRLEKRDPSAAMSDPVEPIVYYLDPGTPEPIRSALMDGARWWNQAFEAAGYRNAFRVELLPEGASSHDIRYNVINWVHRSTRGWSYGGNVTDPRTGEIVKGVVTLGSLRIRQDYLIAEGLLAPYETGDETPAYLAEWGLARIRQLSAHEVGHTIGLAHNYYNSRVGRISVMDYPHPLVRLTSAGGFDHSEVYDADIGEWDQVAVTYGYQHFPAGTNEAEALEQILNDAWRQDVRFLTNQDIATTPMADQWANGTDVAGELDRMMAVRRAALARFGERVIRRGAPLATMEETLVPLYLHHRYQVEAAATALGGINYEYALRGDGRPPMARVPGDAQRAALRSLLATLVPAELALPDALLRTMPPRPMGYPRHRELFPRNTGGAFDAVTPAATAAQLVVTNLLNPARAARVVQQRALDPSLPGLDEVIDALLDAAFGARARNAYEAEIARAVQRVVVDGVMELAGGAGMPQVRAVAALRLERRMTSLRGTASPDDATAAHAALVARDIQRFLDREGPEYTTPGTPDAPPGAPIGHAAMEWLRLAEPACTWVEVRQE
jgi:hypothetical protein